MLTKCKKCGNDRFVEFSQEIITTENIRINEFGEADYSQSNLVLTGDSGGFISLECSECHTIFEKGKAGVN